MAYMPVVSLKQLFSERFNDPITKQQIDAWHRYTQEYELRGSHPETFNTALLGVTAAHFLPKDQSALFEIFGIDRQLFQRCITICPNVDKSHIVTSDEFNLLVVWLAHRVINSTLPSSVKQIGLFDLFKMMNYRFFTGVVNYNFPHKANEAVMQYTVDELSLKYDIRKPETPTWKLVIEARSKDVYASSSIHYRTLQAFAPDDKVLYIISDTQTRMRTRLINIIQNYYTNYKSGKKIDSTNMTAGVGDEKSVRELTATFDVMTSNITNQVLNTNKFINEEYIKLVCKLSASIRPDMMRSMLTKFSEVAMSQYQRREQYRIDGKGSRALLIGYYELISNIIQKTYRSCQLDPAVDMRSKLSILDKTRNLYRSSRIADPGILVVKNSVEYFINQHTSSIRSSTNASMKIAFILYIIILSFEYL